MLKNVCQIQLKTLPGLFFQIIVERKRIYGGQLLVVLTFQKLQTLQIVEGERFDVFQESAQKIS